jgi:vancomycin permeability regulator SanA
MDCLKKKLKEWKETKNNNIFRLSNSFDIDNNFDVIIVMTGGLDKNGGLHLWVKNRLDLAINLYKNKKSFIICTGGGTYHKPPILNKDKFVIHEATACAEYLINNNVNPLHIIREWASYDTIASVYFTLLLCILPRKWKNIGIITSSFHMERVSLIFRWIFGIYNISNLIFMEVNDDNIDKNIIEIRKSREKRSVNNVRKLISNIKTIEEFNIWLFSEHKAYSSDFLLKDRENIDKREKQSY